MKVYELLATPDKWIKGFSARDANGKPTLNLFDDAVCFCLGAAVERCYPDEEDNLEVRRRLRQRMWRITQWNDAPERTHAEVLELCKELDI